MIETFNNDSFQWAIGKVLKVVEIVESVKLRKQQKTTETLTPSWRSPCHIETSPLICIANQWTGFYMIIISSSKSENKDMYVICFKKGGPSKRFSNHCLVWHVHTFKIISVPRSSFQTFVDTHTQYPFLTFFWHLSTQKTFVSFSNCP